MPSRPSLLPGEYYLISLRGVDERDLFIDELDRSRFLTTLYLANSGEPIHRSDYMHRTDEEIYALAKDTSLVEIGAYRLATDHIEILLYEATLGGTSKFMQKLLTAYTMYFNKRHQRRGSLFAGKFTAKHLGGDNELRHAYARIHLPAQPIEQKKKTAELTDDHEYTYSSVPEYLGADRPQGKILTPEAFPLYFEQLKERGEEMRTW